MRYSTNTNDVFGAIMFFMFMALMPMWGLMILSAIGGCLK
jgi:hypothetical protein